jgi:hypothetical protein
MLVIIEYSGSESQTKQVHQLAQYLEDTHGATVQPVVSDEAANIVMLDENLNLITEFPVVPENEVIDFYMNIHTFEDD